MISEKLPYIGAAGIPGPKSLELLSKRKQFVARGVSNATEVFVDEAKGALIKDVDGNVFIDFVSAIGVQNLGHCDDEIIDTIKRQSERYICQGFNIVMHEEYAALAELLCEATPGDFPKKVMFANSGAEAVENVVKLARRHTKKIGIISLENAYHGRTYMTMTLTSKVKPYKYGFGPFNSDTYKIPSAYCYRCSVQSSYPDCGLACAERLRTLLKGELCADSIGLFIAEPIQGEGGFIVPPKDYFAAIQQICNENEIVFAMDEIQSGFARTGYMFASEYFGITPDMISVAKSIAAGLPLSGVIGKSEIMDSANPGEIGGTYAGNPVACAVGLKVMEKIKKDGIIDKANEVGRIITNRLHQMREVYQAVGDVRGLGAMMAIEFVKDRQSREPDPELLKRVINYAYKRGVLFLSAGVFSNVLRFLPPLVITEEQVNYAMDVLDEAIRVSR